MNFAWRIYRWLARAFPHEFKLAYGADVLQLGEDAMRDIAKRHGAAGLVRMIADIMIRVPLEYLTEMRRDMRYALRAMIKSPGFALVGIVSMGLGMALTTVVYSSQWKLITRELPAAANAKHLVMPEKPVSYFYIEQYRDQKDLFSGVAAFQTGIPFNVTFQSDVNAKPERVFGQLVSGDYFSVLGVPSRRGRVLSLELDKPGDGPVVVISDRFWRNRLNSSPDAVGQTLRLNGQPATIVGITPRNFNGALAMHPAELFVPITVPAVLAPELGDDVLHHRNAREFLAIMCLAPGVTIGSAESALDAITRRLDEQDPSAPKRADKGRRVTLLLAGGMVPLPLNLKPVIAGFFFVLMGLIMLIACMNLANMLLARGANRQKELAIRLAVGASRFRLVRQMMSEGILLSLLGGIAGFALAYFLAVLKSQFAPFSAVPLESDFTPDWHAAIFVFALAIVCGIGFSLAPALRATKADVTPALKEGSALQLPGYLRFGLRNFLIVAQVTGSLMLLLITGFLVMGLTKTSSIQTKFDPHSMYLLSIDPVRNGYTPEKARALFEKLPEQLKTSGPVRSVALAAQAPFSIQDEDEAIQLTAEDEHGASRVQISAVEETVGAGYFAALNEPMLAGREFIELDQRSQSDGSKTLPVVLNESAARGFFGNGNAIGGRIQEDKQSYEVIGVVRDLKNGVASSRSVVYLPLTQRNFSRPPADGITIMVRSDSGTDALSGIRRQIAFINPNLTIFNVRTLSDHLELSRSAQRFAVTTYGGIGVFGLVLAAIGLAGVTAYAVARRRREIGIRMALGARKQQVLLLVLREGTALVGVGTVLGFLGAFALAKMLSALTNVFVDALKVGTNDPRLLVGAPLLLAGLALLACYVPARRAAKIDPLKALREG
ncbi:MAG TPA: ABC transporter permease [Candidatus Dormibacteraeota bacterium]|jgi:macrolide transport system ATP-binding/permease protein|nr:ABC transporter permease [Candidatus Dormibacteraeota bacterium]